MNYLTVYRKFIADRSVKQPAADYDRHHILPKCMGGTDHPDNLIRLSRSDHFFAHLLLARIHRGKLAVAAYMMANTCGVAKVKVSRRNYEWLRNEHCKYASSSQSVRMKDPERRRMIADALKGRTVSDASIGRRHQTRLLNNGGVYTIVTPEMRAACAKRMKGTKFSDATKKKMSVAQAGRITSETSRAKISASIRMDWQREARRVAATGRECTAEHRAKLSVAKRGHSVSEQTRMKISAKLKGQQLSAETRRKIGDALRGRDKSVETKARLSAAARADWRRRRAAKSAEVEAI